MTQAIQRENEPLANKVRRRLGHVMSDAQQTYTPTQLVIKKAKGSWLWTVDGHRLIDFTAGVLVANLGHAHPEFERLYKQYTGDLPRNAYNMVAPVEVEASERIVKSLDYFKAQKVLWAASGSEGIHKAMWAALRRYPTRNVLVATRGGFHGKKGLAADVSGETSDNPNVHFISFPMDEDKPAAFYKAELDALGAKFRNKIALLITEPYLGARGSYHPPRWYHQLLQAWCEKHGIAFIFDEVQSCHGRTGSMYAFQSYGVQPDLVVLGKGLGNGEPVAAVVGRADLLDSLACGEASDSYSGNPRACAAVCAALDVFQKERVVAHCRKMAKVMREGLEGLRKRFAFIHAVRGEGLVYGIEMRDDATANACVLEAYRGAARVGVHFLGPLVGKVLRVSPPLTITVEELHTAFGVLDRAWGRIQ